MKTNVELDEIFNLEKIIQIAFDQAKDKVKNRHNQGDEFVNRFEFRLMLVFLKKYFEILKIFIEYDKGMDGKMNLEEFREFLAKVDA